MGGEPEERSTAPQAPGSVVVVDDYEELLGHLARVLSAAGYEVTTHSTAGAFLAAPPPPPPCCVLLDVDMPGLSGLEAQKRIVHGPRAPSVVFITGSRDVSTTIEAFRGGAVDYLLKPFTDEVLLAAVARALEGSAERQRQAAATDQARERLGLLTPREREVCLLVADGLTSKEIGERLGVVEGTVALHRTRIMPKLGARSVADLVRLVDLAGRGG